MQGSYEAKKFSLVAVAVEGSLKLEHALPQAMQAQDGSVLERKGWQVEWRKDVAGTLASPLAPPYCIPLGWGMWDVSGVACQLGLSWPDCNAIDPRKGGGGNAGGEGCSNMVSTNPAVLLSTPAQGEVEGRGVERYSI
jgi:hypothetical protein